VIDDQTEFHKIVYSQCAVHIVVGPCTKGHFIHARSSLDPEFFLKKTRELATKLRSRMICDVED
jgi:hypothetical protein